MDSLLIYFIYGVISLVLAIIGFKVYLKWTTGICTCDTKLDGKISIITGSNSGIGFETAKDLAKRGCKVILACRDVTKGQEACDQIKSEIPQAKVFTKKLDLSSLKSVRDFCKKFIKEESKLDILICNAGLVIDEKIMTEEGFELEFVTNHLGHFLMTNILLEKMKNDGGKIVIVSSMAHKFTGKRIDFDNLNSEKSWNGSDIYAKTKLYNILFMRELDRRLNDKMKGKIICSALHPGAVRTPLFRHAKKNPFFNLILFIAEYFFKTPWEGAQTQILLSVSPNTPSGLFWADCKVTKTSTLAENMEIAKELWERSTEFVKFQPDEFSI